MQEKLKDVAVKMWKIGKILAVKKKVGIWCETGYAEWTDVAKLSTASSFESVNREEEMEDR